MSKSGTLRFYVWGHVVALEDWAPGYAFALAESREQAIELILRDRQHVTGGLGRSSKTRTDARGSA